MVMDQNKPSPSIDATRIQVLNHKKIVPGRYVLYWMQQSQRAEENHALEYGIELANHLDLPLLVVFGLTDAAEQLQGLKPLSFFHAFCRG